MALARKALPRYATCSTVRRRDQSNRLATPIPPRMADGGAGTAPTKGGGGLGVWASSLANPVGCAKPCANVPSQAPICAAKELPLLLSNSTLAAELHVPLVRVRMKLI